MRQSNPFKGLYSYEEEDSAIFYGREEEKRKLFGLVRYNSQAVVFGKSGIGKTSLLRAGLFPLLREAGYFPIVIRLNYRDEELGLLEQAEIEIRKALEGERHGVRVSNGERLELGEKETLWEYFHRVRFEGPDNVEGGGFRPVKPVLVLDQFEEMFTLGKGHVELESWEKELYYLMEDELPDGLRVRLLDSENDDVPDYGVEPLDLRMVLVLREDYLADLSGLKRLIPSIDRVMFRLLHFNGRQAREVISRPGVFGEGEMVERILRVFYPDEWDGERAIADKELEVEPSLLSLVCHRVVAEGKVKTFGVADRESILEGYYDWAMGDKSRKVRTYIENHLITEGGFRTPHRVERDLEFRSELLELENRRFLRKVSLGKKRELRLPMMCWRRW